jgi:hypothetical protein
MPEHHAKQPEYPDSFFSRNRKLGNVVRDSLHADPAPHLADEPTLSLILDSGRIAKPYLQI